MLKKRVSANLVVKDGIVVQSIGFKKYLPVGKPEIAIEFLNNWGIDEIIILDISASKARRNPDYNMVRIASSRCQVPLTVGGGIFSVDSIKELMHCGADKISLNRAAILQPELITSAAQIFGDQCVVVSIDAVGTHAGYRVYDYVERKALDITPAIFAKQCVERGAGEILINSVDRDGSYKGYDITLINEVCDSVSVPVICCGGARNAQDFVNVFSTTKVSAASAANFYHFSEHSVNISKAYIKRYMNVRIDTFADYQDNEFTDDLRLLKKDDVILEKMLFLRIEKEII